jgi:hypothetical protein
MRKKKSEIVEPQPGSVLEYLRTASPALLEAFELDRLNRVANLEKGLRAMLDEMVKEMAEASLARMLREHRKVFHGAKRNRTVSADRLSEIAKQFPKLLNVGKAVKP